MSFVGLLTAPLLIGSAIAGLFGAAGLRQIRRANGREEGQGFAIAALAISVSSLLLGFEALLHRLA